MASGERGDVLQRQHIVLIHEDAFVAQYLADVIAQSGGVVTRPIGLEIDAALSDSAALVLSDTAPQRDLVLARTSELGLPLLIVRSAQRCLTIATTDRVLTVPFAGFQVVEVLCELLQQPGAPRSSPPGSRQHGH